jgi:hypothetical protein
MEFNVNVNVRYWSSAEVAGIARLLVGIRDKLETLEGKVGELMALSQESKDLLKKVDDATSAIGARIQALLDRPNTTEQEFRDALTPIATALENLGKDPVNPIPPMPPTP